MKQKRILTLLIAFSTLLLQFTAAAQIDKLRNKISVANKIDYANRPLDWYQVRVSPAAAPGAASILRTKPVGNKISMVGVNLQRAQNVIAASGNSNYRLASEGYCETQNLNMDYLNEGAFNLVNVNQTFAPIIFPGSFIEAGSLLDKTPVMYSRATGRAPLTVGISITNPNSTAPAQVSVNDFGTNNIGFLNTELRNKHFGAAIPPVFAFSLKEISSIEHFTASLNYSVGITLPLEEFGIPVDLSQGITGSGGISTEKKMHSYVVSFIQPMYAYSVNEVDMNRFFTTAGVAAQHSTAGFVSSVVYGRMALLTFQSSEDSASINLLLGARLGVSFTGGELANAKLGLAIDISAKNNFSNKIKNFKAFVYGGDAQSALRVTSNPGDIYSFIQNTSAYSLSAATGALPVQYTVNRVSDGRSIGVRSTSSFSIEDCINPKYDVTVKVTGIKCNKVVEFPTDDAEDIFGNCTIGNKTLFNINEDAAVSIRQGKTAVLDGEKINVAPSKSINELKNLRLAFAPNLKDWEMVTKPKYREKQPGDLIFNFDNKINQLYKLEPGQSVLIDGRNPKSIDLYENGDANSSSITILYQIEVTRK